MTLSSQEFKEYQKLAFKKSKEDQKDVFGKRSKMFIKSVNFGHKIILSAITDDNFQTIKKSDFPYNQYIINTLNGIEKEMKQEFTKTNIKVKINDFDQFYKKYKGNRDRMQTPVHVGDCLWSPMMNKLQKFIIKIVDDIDGPNTDQRDALIYFAGITDLYLILIGTIKHHRTGPMPIIVGSALIKSDELHEEIENIDSSIKIDEFAERVERMKKREKEKGNSKKIKVAEEVANGVKNHLKKLIQNYIRTICKLFGKNIPEIVQTINKCVKMLVEECVGKNAQHKKRYIEKALIFGGKHTIQPLLHVMNSNSILETQSNLIESDIKTKECARQVAEVVRRFGMDKVLNQIELLSQRHVNMHHINNRGRNRYRCDKKRQVRDRSRSRDRNKNKNYTPNIMNSRMFPPMQNGNIVYSHTSNVPLVPPPFFHNMSTIQCGGSVITMNQNHRGNYSNKLSYATNSSVTRLTTSPPKPVPSMPPFPPVNIPPIVNITSTNMNPLALYEHQLNNNFRLDRTYN